MNKQKQKYKSDPPEYMSEFFNKLHISLQNTKETASKEIFKQERKSTYNNLNDKESFVKRMDTQLKAEVDKFCGLYKPDSDSDSDDY